MTVLSADMRSFKVKCPTCSNVVEFYRHTRSKTAWECPECNNVVHVNREVEESDGGLEKQCS